MSVEERPITVGELVSIHTHDGATFHGVLQELELEWLTLNGCGFPLADIERIERA